MRIVLIIADDRDVKGDRSADTPCFGPAPSALLEGLASVRSGVEVHVVAGVRQKLPAPEKLSDNIFYHQVLVPGGYRRTLFVDAVRKFRTKIKEIDPDVVHGQGTEDYQGICAAFSGCPNCITIHGNMRAVARRVGYRPFPSMAITALSESVALRKTDMVICNSGYTERCVARLNHHKPRIFNAVRKPFFELERNGEYDPILLCVGDILPYKNQIALIHALDDFPPDQRERGWRKATAMERSEMATIGKIKLLFAGSCRPDSRYGRAFMNEVAGRDWCGYAGRLELDALLELMLNCRGVVHPTLEDSFGLAVAEAQAAGVPVVASAIGGIPDLIEHGKTGLLFNPHDPADIRQQVEQLMDRNVSGALAMNARIFANAEYRPECVARKHLKLYERLACAG